MAHNTHHHYIITDQPHVQLTFTCTSRTRDSFPPHVNITRAREHQGHVDSRHAERAHTQPSCFLHGHVTKGHGPLYIHTISTVSCFVASARARTHNAHTHTRTRGVLCTQVGSHSLIIGTGRVDTRVRLSARG